jgi:hypothetical protein
MNSETPQAARLMMDFLEYWRTHLPVLAGSLLVLSSLATFYFPRIVLRRQPKLSRGQLIKRHPRLGWLIRLQILWVLVFILGAALLFGLVRAHLPRQPTEDQVGFLVTAAVSALPLSDGVFALLTGVYRDVTGRYFADAYFYDARQEQPWIPWTQTLAALTIAAASLAGFWAVAPRP